LIKEAANGDLTPIALIENLQREDLSVIEKAIGFYRLKEEKGNIDSVANILGLDRRTVERYLKFAESISAIPELAEIVKSKKLNFTMSYELCLLSDKLLTLKKSSPKRYRRLLNRIKEAKDISQSFIDKIKARVGKKTEGGNKDRIERKDFWLTETEIGLNLRVSVADASIPEIRDILSNEARDFFHAIGATKFEVEF